MLCRIIFFAILFQLTGFAAQASADEQVLRFQYKINCDRSDQSSFPGLVGEVSVGSRKLRVVLFSHQNHAEVNLGKPNDKEVMRLKVKWFRHPTCQFDQVNHEILALRGETAIAELALKHSPYIVLRPDQVSRVDRDLPMHLAYSLIPAANGGISIRYTLTFSNESDYGLFATTKAKSMRQYGRRTDIEWVYEVDFDSNQKILKRRFQSGVKFGIGHATWLFNGQYVKGTSHPVLYNIAKHNVFSAIPFPGQTQRTPAFHLVPREELPFPEAREEWMWRNPWSFEVSDRELRRTGRLTHDSDQYLYIKVDGNLAGGKLTVEGTGFAESSIQLKKLGEDSWGKQAYIAVRLKRFPSADTFRGDRIQFVLSKREARLKSIQFLALSKSEALSFSPNDLGAYFRCELSSNLVSCHY